METYGVLNECGTAARVWLDEGSNIDAIQSVMAEPEPPFYLQQVQSSKCVHASGGPAGKGVPLVMWNGCFDKKNKLDKVSIGRQGESFYLRNYDKRLCIHVDDSDRLVYNSSCIGKANAFREVDDGMGSWHLQHLKTQRFVKSDDDGKLVLQQPGATAYDSFRKIELSTIQLQADPTKCLDVFDEQPYLNMRLWDCAPGKPNQQFVVSPSTRQIRWTESERNLCLDVLLLWGTFSDNGHHIILRECDENSLNQRLELRANGELVFVNDASHKCLEPEHNGIGGKLALSDCSGQGFALSAAR